MENKKTLIPLDIIFALIAGSLFTACAFLYFGNDDAVVENPEHDEKQGIIDSLTADLEHSRITQDSLERVVFVHDSIDAVKLEQIKTQFNEKEKKQRMAVVGNLSDTNQLQFLSNWLPKSDSLGR